MSNPRPAHDKGQLEQELRRHEQCMRVISELEECVTGDASGESLERVQGCFDRFFTTVRAQLEGEDKRRLFRELPAKYPRLAHRIDALRTQHQRIGAELDALAALIGRPRDVLAGPVRERVRSLIAELRDLEKGETSVLQSAYWREDGVAG